jgi:putative ABC transport system permease protein
MREIRYAARRLLRAPVFSIAVALTLGLVMAANLTIFTLLEGVVLRALPYPHSERLVVLDHSAVGLGVQAGYGVARGIYHQYARLRGIEAIGLYQPGLDTTIIAAGEPERVTTLRSTASLEAVLGLQLAAGRWFTDADSARNAQKVTVLTLELAERLYGNAVAAVGRVARLDNVPFEVVGVLERRTLLPDRNAHVLLPFSYYSAERIGPFGSRCVARLREGVSFESVRAETRAVIADLSTRFPGDARALEAVATAQLEPLVIPLKEHTLGNFKTILWLLMGSAIVVFLIACANLANLFFVRSIARRGEWGIRSALGATGVRAMAGFVAEPLLVSAAGGFLGLALAAVSTQWLANTAPFDVPRLQSVRLNFLTAVTAACLSVAAGTVLGLIPMVHFRGPVSKPLSETFSSHTDDPISSRWRRMLVALQIGLTVVLLSCAGLFYRSFQQLTHVDLGFREGNRLTFALALPPSKYPQEAAVTFHEELLARLRILPGVHRAAVSTVLPLSGEGMSAPLEVRGEAPGESNARVSVLIRYVSTDYIATLGIPVLRGRDFSRDDSTGRAAIINQALADRYFPTGGELDGEVRRHQSIESWSTIVGVVANSITVSLDEERHVPQLLLPLRSAAGGLSTLSYVIHTDGDPAGLIPVVRQLRTDLDSTAALIRPERFSSVVRRASAVKRFSAILMGLAAAAGFLLGAVGIYGVVAYGVALRTREIGLRLALGASRKDVIWMIIQQGLVPIMLGIGFGLWASFSINGQLRGQFFAVHWYDPATYILVTSGVFSLAILSSWVPAVRAASTSPLSSLKRP